MVENGIPGDEWFPRCVKTGPVNLSAVPLGLPMHDRRRRIRWIVPTGSHARHEQLYRSLKPVARERNAAPDRELLDLLTLLRPIENGIDNDR